MMRCCLALVWLLMAAVSVRAGEPGAKALKLFETLAKRPAPGFLFEQFYAAWLEDASPEELVTFLEEKSKHAPEARQILALLQARSGNLAQAVEGYRKLIAEAPQKPEVYFQLADLESRSGKLDAAVATLEAGLRTSPAPSPTVALKLRQLQGRVLAKSGQAEKAVAVWQELMKAEPDDEELQEDFIELQMQLGREEEALGTAQALVDHTKDPYKKVMRRLKVIELQQQRRQHAEVLKTSEQCLEEVGNDSWLEKEILNQIDQSFRRSDQISGLLEYLRTLSAKFPQRFSIRQRLAQALTDNGRVDESLDIWRDMLRLTPGDVAMQEQFVSMLAVAGKLEEAIGRWKDLIQLHPGNAEWQLKLAEVYHTANRKSDAVQSVREFINTSGNNEAAFARAAVMLTKFQAKDEALAILKEACAAFPDSDALSQQHASGLHAAGSKDAAMAIWKQQAAVADETKLLNLGRLVAAKGEVQFAFDLMQSRAADFPKGTAFQSLLSDLAQQLDKWDIALQASRQVLELTTDPLLFDSALTQVLQCAEKGNRLPVLQTELEAAESGGGEISPASQCLLAALWERSGKVSAAEALLNKVTVKDSTLGLSMLVRLQSARQLFAQAATTQARLVAGPGGRKAIHFQKLVELLEKAGRIQEGLRAIEDWKPLVSGSPAPWLKEVALLQQIGKEPEAMKVLRQASQLMPGKEELLLPVAKLCQDNDGAAEAQQIYLSLFEKASETSAKLRLISLLADSAAASNRLEYWIGEFEQRRASNRTSPLPILALAELQRKNGKPEARLNMMLAAARLQRDDKDVLMAVAREAMAQGFDSLAASTLLEAEKQDATGAAKGMRALLLLQVGREAEAGRLLGEIAATFTSEEAGNLAAGLVEAGFRRAAIAILTPLTQKDPDNYRIGYVLARLLEECGEDVRALDEYVRLLAIRAEMVPFAKAGEGRETSFMPSGYQNGMEEDFYTGALLATNRGISTGLRRARIPGPIDPPWGHAAQLQRNGQTYLSFTVPETRAALAGRVLRRCAVLAGRIDPLVAVELKSRLQATMSPYVLVYEQMSPGGFQFNWDQMATLFEQHPAERRWLAELILRSSSISFSTPDESAEESGQTSPQLSTCPAPLYAEALKIMLPLQTETTIKQALMPLFKPASLVDAGRSLVQEYLTTCPPNPRLVESLAMWQPWSDHSGAKDEALFQAMLTWMPSMPDEAHRQWLTTMLVEGASRLGDSKAQMQLLDAAFESGASDASISAMVRSPFAPGYISSQLEQGGATIPRLFPGLQWPPRWLVASPANLFLNLSGVDDNAVSFLPKADAWRPLLPGLKNQVLRLFVTTQIKDSAETELSLTQIDQASSPNLPALLAAAVWAWHEAKPDECISRFHKAWTNATDENLRLAIDHTMIGAALLLQNGGLLPAPNSPAHGQLREAMLRRKDLPWPEPLKFSVVKVMRKLGLVNEALMLARSAPASPMQQPMPTAPAMAASSNVALSQLLTGLEKLLPSPSSNSVGRSTREMVNYALFRAENVQDESPNVSRLNEKYIKPAGQVLAERAKLDGLTGYEVWKIAQALQILGLPQMAEEQYLKAESLSPFDQRIRLSHLRMAMNEGNETKIDRLAAMLPEPVRRVMEVQRIANDPVLGGLDQRIERLEKLRVVAMNADKETLAKIAGSLGSLSNQLAANWEVNGFRLPSLDGMEDREIRHTRDSKIHPDAAILKLNERRREGHRKFLESMVSISDRLPDEKAELFYAQLNSARNAEGASRLDLADNAVSFLLRASAAQRNGSFTWRIRDAGFTSSYSMLVESWQMVVEKLLSDPQKFKPSHLQPLLDNETTQLMAQEILRCLPLMTCREAEFVGMANALINDQSTNANPSSSERLQLICGIADTRKFGPSLARISMDVFQKGHAKVMQFEMTGMAFFMSGLRGIMQKENHLAAIELFDQFLNNLKNAASIAVWKLPQEAIGDLDYKLETLDQAIRLTLEFNGADAFSTLLGCECRRRMEARLRSAPAYAGIAGRLFKHSTRGSLDVENIIRPVSKLDARMLVQYMRDAGFLAGADGFRTFATAGQENASVYVSFLDFLRQSSQLEDVLKLLALEPESFGRSLTLAALAGESHAPLPKEMVAVLVLHLDQLKALPESQAQELAPLRYWLNYWLKRGDKPSGEKDLAAMAWLNGIEPVGLREDIERFISASDEWDDLPCEPGMRDNWVKSVITRNSNLSADVLVKLIKKEAFFQELAASLGSPTKNAAGPNVVRAMDELLNSLCSSISSSSEDRMREIGIVLQRLAAGDDQLSCGYFAAYRQFSAMLRQQWLTVNDQSVEKFDPALLVQQLGRTNESMAEFALPSLTNRATEFWDVTRLSLNADEDEVRRWLDEAKPDDKHPLWAISLVKDLWGDRPNRTSSTGDSVRRVAAESLLQQRIERFLKDERVHLKVRFAWLVDCLNNTSFSISPKAALQAAKVVVQAQELPEFRQWGEGYLALNSLVPGLLHVTERTTEWTEIVTSMLRGLKKSGGDRSRDILVLAIALKDDATILEVARRMTKSASLGLYRHLVNAGCFDAARFILSQSKSDLLASHLDSWTAEARFNVKTLDQLQGFLPTIGDAVQQYLAELLMVSSRPGSEAVKDLRTERLIDLAKRFPTDPLPSLDDASKMLQFFAGNDACEPLLNPVRQLLAGQTSFALLIAESKGSQQSTMVKLKMGYLKSAADAGKTEALNQALKEIGEYGEANKALAKELTLELIEIQNSVSKRKNGLLWPEPFFDPKILALFTESSPAAVVALWTGCLESAVENGGLDKLEADFKALPLEQRGAINGLLEQRGSSNAITPFKELWLKDEAEHIAVMKRLLLGPFAIPGFGIGSMRQLIENGEEYWKAFAAMLPDLVRKQPSDGPCYAGLPLIEMGHQFFEKKMTEEAGQCFDAAKAQLASESPLLWQRAAVDQLAELGNLLQRSADVAEVIVGFDTALFDSRQRGSSDTLLSVLNSLSMADRELFKSLGEETFAAQISERVKKHSASPLAQLSAAFAMERIAVAHFNEGKTALAKLEIELALLKAEEVIKSNIPRLNIAPHSSMLANHAVIRQALGETIEIVPLLPPGSPWKAIKKVNGEGSWFKQYLKATALPELRAPISGSSIDSYSTDWESDGTDVIFFSEFWEPRSSAPLIKIYIAAKGADPSPVRVNQNSFNWSESGSPEIIPNIAGLDRTAFSLRSLGRNLFKTQNTLYLRTTEEMRAKAGADWTFDAGVFGLKLDSRRLVDALDKKALEEAAPAWWKNLGK